MSAASVSAPVPLYSEGKYFWENLIAECERQVQCANATLRGHGVDPGGLLQCIPALDALQIVKPRRPSVAIQLILNFRNWGPVIDARFWGEQKNGKKFLPQEFELPIATDLDRQTVAIFDEGRSFSPREVSSYLLQYFHCCYPTVSFPC